MREKKLLALFHAGHGGNVPRIERAVFCLSSCEHTRSTAASPVECSPVECLGPLGSADDFDRTAAFRLTYRFATDEAAGDGLQLYAV
jgi:hypothetical protein